MEQMPQWVDISGKAVGTWIYDVWVRVEMTVKPVLKYTGVIKG